jgi:hypothetical protein
MLKKSQRYVLAKRREIDFRKFEALYTEGYSYYCYAKQQSENKPCGTGYYTTGENPYYIAY